MELDADDVVRFSESERLFFERALFRDSISRGLDSMIALIEHMGFVLGGRT